MPWPPRSCMGLGYAVWNIGISRGNMTVLAGASYFIPVFFCAGVFVCHQCAVVCAVLAGGRDGVAQVQSFAGWPRAENRYNKNIFLTTKHSFPFQTACLK